MSKQYYFAVVVEEDGTAWIDHEHEVNYGCGNVWNPEVSDWEASHEEQNYDAFEVATEKLNKILQGK